MDDKRCQRKLTIAPHKAAFLLGNPASGKSAMGRLEMATVVGSWLAIGVYRLVRVVRETHWTFLWWITEMLRGEGQRGADKRSLHG